MSFSVVSSLSAEELEGLGQMHEKHSQDQTGTLITGHDVNLTDNVLSSWVEKLCIRSRGNIATAQGYLSTAIAQELGVADVVEGV